MRHHQRAMALCMAATPSAASQSAIAQHVHEAKATVAVDSRGDLEPRLSRPSSSMRVEKENDFSSRFHRRREVKPRHGAHRPSHTTGMACRFPIHGDLQNKPDHDLFHDHRVSAVSFVS
ncbi:hypothetical protein MANES_16G059850v8 [Manihot esculenta]|uniref:Uncharacterized protein n=1 Tax=Manihot esculenta TaxID=3983 RepID=A0ACB7G6U6_MANES|nr:hypothetical protein MANES_16G059850v8 [Manihot esculenta]